MQGPLVTCKRPAFIHILGISLGPKVRGCAQLVWYIISLQSLPWPELAGWRARAERQCSAQALPQLGLFLPTP